MLLNFDFDGVIADSFEHMFQICSESQKKLAIGRPLVEDDFRTIENLNFDAIANRIGITGQNEIEEYKKIIKQYQTQLPSDLKIFTGIENILVSLSQEHVITIITSNNKVSIDQYFSQFAFFDSVISEVLGPESNQTKTERISDCCENFGFKKEQTYMIGDTISDIRSGKDAKVKTVGVTWGYQDRLLLAEQSPTYLIDNINDLLEVFSM